jgi:hypothetical protein
LFKKRSRIKGADDLQGLELIRALPRLAEQDRLLSAGGEPQRLTKFLGEAGALQAIEAIQNRPEKIESRIASIRQARERAGGRRSPLRKSLSTIQSDPQASAVLAKQRAEQREAVGREARLAQPENLLQAVINERDRVMRNRGFGEGAITLSSVEPNVNRMVFGLVSAFTGRSGAAEQLRHLRRQNRLPGMSQFVDEDRSTRLGDRQLLQRIERFLDGQDDAAEKQQQAAESMKQAAEAMQRGAGGGGGGAGGASPATQPSNQTE